MPRHRIQRILQIVFGTAGHDLTRHHLFCFRGFGISPNGHNLQSQIAIGHDETLPVYASFFSPEPLRKKASKSALT